ncbi:MAG: type II toxin-antitoxin system PemK/MazF family toxin [Candidatus Moraniibacteriota bacterium]
MKYKILFAPFPFGNLKTKKFRPVLCLTNPQGKHKELLLAFITTNITGNIMPSDLIIQKKEKDFTVTGLEKSSVIKLNKLLTLPKNMIVGQLGMLSNAQAKEVKNKLKKLLDI